MTKQHVVNESLLAKTVPAQPGQMEAPRRGKQGFASMDPDKVRRIAAMGGNSVPSDKRPFARDRELAVSAGRKGGQKSQAVRAQLN